MAQVTQGGMTEAEQIANEMSKTFHHDGERNRWSYSFTDN